LKEERPILSNENKAIIENKLIKEKTKMILKKANVKLNAINQDKKNLKSIVDSMFKLGK
jgi:hypothetical protein